MAVTKRHVVCMWPCTPMWSNMPCGHKVLSIHMRPRNHQENAYNAKHQIYQIADQWHAQSSTAAQCGWHYNLLSFIWACYCSCQASRHLCLKPQMLAAAMTLWLRQNHLCFTAITTMTIAIAVSTIVPAWITWLISPHCISYFSNHICKQCLNGSRPWDSALMRHEDGTDQLGQSKWYLPTKFPIHPMKFWRCGKYGCRNKGLTNPINHASGKIRPSQKNPQSVVSANEWQC